MAHKAHMSKYFIIGLFTSCITLSTAYAQGPDPARATELGTTESGVTETNKGSCSNCRGWVWAHAKECWRWVSGSEERIYVDYLEAKPSFTDQDTGDTRHSQFIAACASGHWVGQYWKSSSSYSNVRLWGN